MKDRTLKLIFAISLLVAILFPLISILYVYPAFTNMIVSNTENEALRTGAHFERMYFNDAKPLTAGSINNTFIQGTRDLIDDYDLMKIKVFAASGETIFSSDQEDIGKINKKPYFHDVVAHGNSFTKMVQKDTKSLEGQIVTADVIETYIPLMKGGKFSGAFEFYYDITQRNKRLNRIALYASITPLGLMFVFIVAIALIIVRSSRGLSPLALSKNALRFRSPYISMFSITLAIILFETIAMICIMSIPSLSEMEKMILDAMILVMLLTPTIYFFLIQPLIKYNAELGTAKTLLKENQDILVNEHAALTKAFSLVENAKLEWEKTVDCVEDIIIRTDRNGNITRCNKTLQVVTDKPYNEIIGYHWEDFITDYKLEVTTLFDNSTELYHEPTGKWFVLNSYPFYDKELQFSGNVITIHDNTETKHLEEALMVDNTRLAKTQEELKEAYNELKSAQSQMLQKEKMASIGQLAAGVAHEINNPMGFIASNVSSLGRYTKKITEFIHLQDEAIASSALPELLQELDEKRKTLKLDFILEDIDQLIEESLDGADRVKQIVQNLKSFSRVDEAEHKEADINECLESTLNIVWNELKYKATITKEYGEIPILKCYPQQLNQVFVNLLVNASHAIEKQGEIKIKTWNGDGKIKISVSDTGAGIEKDKVEKIFEPFFTTKPVGKGTGLGLSIAYDIVKKHNGEITVETEVGKGTTFTVQIPVVKE